jgi:RNA polymerase sigma factor (sigma-70 family)
VHEEDLREDIRPLAETSAATAPCVADEVVRRYRAPLIRFFERRLRNRTDAEDLTQEVLLRLARQPSRGREARPAYIFVIARSVLLDGIRREQVRERLGRHALWQDDTDCEAPSAERVYSAQERAERVSRLMAQLSPRVREVFIMQRVEGRAYSEIARALGISLSTVEKHMMTALRLLVQHADEVR